MTKPIEKEDSSTEQDKINNNPDGKGGFGDNPENINKGGRPQNPESFVYWYHIFKGMTVEEFKTWQEDNPEDTRTVAANLAYTRIINSQKSLRDFQEVADRSEGKSKQPIKHEGIGLEVIAKQLQDIYDQNREDTEQSPDGSENSE